MNTTLPRRFLTFLTRQAKVAQWTSVYSRAFEMGKENKRLLRLMKKHHLDSKQVAELCRVSKVTVEHWRQAEGLVGHRSMSPGLLELLEIKLGEK